MDIKTYVPHGLPKLGQEPRCPPYGHQIVYHKQKISYVCMYVCMYVYNSEDVCSEPNDVVDASGEDVLPVGRQTDAADLVVVVHATDGLLVAGIPQNHYTYIHTYTYIHINTYISRVVI